ncbi:proline dehydrogenase [Neptunomonas sp. XY-337]|uniref:proline dehydrogenase n=1 Tax=Neptunomonas sp. XY-337 TaxID=2561897 RepID=UPI0010AAE1A0|nr:proline dehydrogenase [Neptunomonas sp. XY-337]
MTHSNLIEAGQRALSAWERWNQHGIAARAEILRQATQTLQQPVAPWLIKQALDVMTPSIELPGPTGESNTLIWEGRGVVAVCAQTKGADDALIAQLVTALLTGNVVLAAVDHPVVQHLQAALTAADFADVLVAVEAPLEALAACEPISLYAFCGEPRDTLALNRNLAQRDGCLAQLVALSTDEPLAHQLTEDFLWRFVTEATITINTTAVGGNASLLELGGREDI